MNIDGVAPLQANGDFDGDGSVEISGARKSGKVLAWTFVSIRKNTSWNATFGISRDVPLGGCDIDGDGVTDLVVVNAGKRLRVLSSKSGTPKNISLVGLTSIPLDTRKIFCSDTEGDKKSEILVLSGSESGKGSSESSSTKLNVYSSKGKKIHSYASPGATGVTSVFASQDKTLSAMTYAKNGSLVLFDSKRGTKVKIGPFKDLVVGHTVGADGSSRSEIRTLAADSKILTYSVAKLFAHPKSTINPTVSVSPFTATGFVR